MDRNRPFSASFERDHVHLSVTVVGTFTADDIEQFAADAAAAARGRRREWTIDAKGLTSEPPGAFVEALVALRAQGHVCLLNPSSALHQAVAEAGADQRIVVRTDSRSADAT